MRSKNNDDDILDDLKIYYMEDISIDKVEMRIGIISTNVHVIRKTIKYYEIRHNIELFKMKNKMERVKTKCNNVVIVHIEILKNVIEN